MQDLPKAADTDISLITISNEKELLKYDLDRLSMELVGKPCDRIFPTYLVFHKGKLRGFFQAPQRTVVYPALNPGSMGPKEYVKILKSLVTELKRATGNPLFLVCQRANELSEHMLCDIGVKRIDDQPFEYDETA